MTLTEYHAAQAADAWADIDCGDLSPRAAHAVCAAVGRQLLANELPDRLPTEGVCRRAAAWLCDSAPAVAESIRTLAERLATAADPAEADEWRRRPLVWMESADAVLEAIGPLEAVEDDEEIARAWDALGLVRDAARACGLDC